MYQKQLQDAINDIGFKNVSGVCSTSPQFAQYVNEVQRRLAKRGNFYGMVFTMNLLFQGCIVAWPREVGTILGVRKGRGSFQVQNSWYSFTGCWRGHHDNWHSDTTFEDLNPSPVTNQIYGQQNVPLPTLYNASSFPAIPPANGMLIRYYVVNKADFGKKITIFGTQYGGQPLQDGTGSSTLNGLTLTAQVGYASTSVYVTDISSVTRDATVGMAYLYQYDPTSNTLIDLAVYQPGDTNPMFRRSLIRNHSVRFCNDGESPTNPKWNSIEALVKLEFIPVVNNRDFLLVDDFDAIKFGIQAIKAEEAGDGQTSEKCWIQAIRELNFGDRNKMPDNHTPVMVNAVLGHRITSPN